MEFVERDGKLFFSEKLAAELVKGVWRNVCEPMIFTAYAVDAVDEEIERRHTKTLYNGEAFTFLPSCGEIRWKNKWLTRQGVGGEWECCYEWELLDVSIKEVVGSLMNQVSGH